jgi:hypothetical protein
MGAAQCAEIVECSYECDSAFSESLTADTTMVSILWRYFRTQDEETRVMYGLPVGHDGTHITNITLNTPDETTTYMELHEHFKRFALGEYLSYLRIVTSSETTLIFKTPERRERCLISKDTDISHVGQILY